MGAMASAVAAGVMFYFTLAAAGAVKDILENEKEAIEAIPLDEAVKEADAEASKKDSSYRRVTVWSSIPLTMKFVLISSVLAMMGCCYLLVIFNSECFREYDLMYTIKQDLDGNWTNIVKPLGRVALLFFSSSCLLYYVFVSWATVSFDDIIMDTSFCVRILSFSFTLFLCILSLRQKRLLKQWMKSLGLRHSMLLIRYHKSFFFLLR